MKLMTAALAGIVLAGSAGLASAASIKVTLEDDAIKLAQASTKAGKVTFDVTNASLTEEHEMVVLQKPAGDLPYDAAKKRVVEAKVKSMGEVSGLKPGASKSFSVSLKPGHYVLICNIKGHYMDGMKIPFDVTP